MELTLTIPNNVASKLKDRADASGMPLPHFISRLLTNAVSSARADELMQPFRTNVADSGLTDDEVMAIGRHELNQLRSERKVKPE